MEIIVFIVVNCLFSKYFIYENEWMNCLLCGTSLNIYAKQCKWCKDEIRQRWFWFNIKNTGWYNLSIGNCIDLFNLLKALVITSCVYYDFLFIKFWFSIEQRNFHELLAYYPFQKIKTKLIDKFSLQFQFQKKIWQNKTNPNFSY